MASSSLSTNAGKILKRANPSTIQDKFLVGYQGWFTCPGDGEPVGPGHHGWLHWFNQPIPDGGHPNTDVWPDVSSYSPSELFPAPGLKTKTGEPVFLFSSRNAKTVQRHFHWMAEHGVDGAFLQRFAGQCDLEAGNHGIMHIRDEVGDRVREAAEREGRVFAIMYDVSGVAPDRIQRILERDWAHLVRNKGVLDSPNYLREKGKPVVALWGFGFDNANHTPALVHSITQFFRNTTPGGIYIMGGTPASWRTAEGDADRNPAFLDIWMNDFDAISPWTVGRYSTEQDADRFFEEKMKGDLDLVKRHNEEGSGRKIDYFPVVLPGGSGFNLSEGKWGFNDIKRSGGRFLWKQISNAKRLGARTMYGAMWDEYDEGTAFMPIVELKRNLPQSDKFRFMALDEDGYDVPSDWYMRICGFAAEGLRSERRIHETFPIKELQDYWSSRPKYEEVSQKSADFVSGSSIAVAGGASGSGAGSNDADGQTYEEWLAAQKENKDEAPPPPYSLEAEEPASTPVVQTQPVGAATANVAVALQTPSTNQTEPTTLTGPPQVVPQNHPGGPPVVNASTYPTSGYVGPGPSSSGPGPVQYQSQDPVVALAHDFGRQSISNLSGAPSSHAPVNISAPTTSSPPLHPAHPAAQNLANGAASEYPGLHSRPSIQGQPRPSSSQARPASQQQYSRPQSQQGYHSGPSVAAVGVSPSPAQATPVPGPWSQGQWPPQEWKVPANQAQAAPSVPQSTYPGASGGANLTRPHTFSASANTDAPGGSLRPSGSVIGRPSSAAPNQIAPPGGYPSPTISGQPPQSSYPSPNTHIPPNNTFTSTPYPQQAASSYTPGPPSVGPPFHAHGHSAHGFPTGPSALAYPLPASSYPGGPVFPERPSNSAYQPMSGSSYTPWSGGPPYISPPHSPHSVGASPFPGQSAYNSRPYSPGQGSGQQQYPSPSFPSSSGSSPPISGPEGGGMYFPHGPGGEESYFSGSNVSVPTNNSTAYGSSYPGQYGTSSSSYPGQGGPAYPQSGSGTPGPWMPPPVPPRLSTQSGSSYGRPSGPTFPVASSSTGSGPLGFALNAVDKVAGRKTREQLESQVGSLAQTGSKLFNKYMK